jgi:hypothetical protein
VAHGPEQHTACMHINHSEVCERNHVDSQSNHPHSHIATSCAGKVILQAMTTSSAGRYEDQKRKTRKCAFTRVFLSSKGRERRNMGKGFNSSCRSTRKACKYHRSIANDSFSMESMPQNLFVLKSANNIPIALLLTEPLYKTRLELRQRFARQLEQDTYKHCATAARRLCC